MTRPRAKWTLFEILIIIIIKNRTQIADWKVLGRNKKILFSHVYQPRPCNNHILLWTDREPTVRIRRGLLFLGGMDVEWSLLVGQ